MLRSKEITVEVLELHRLHDIEIVTYGDPPLNVSLECDICGEVIIDFDLDDSLEPTHKENE
jgi:hypothetical protein